MPAVQKQTTRQRHMVCFACRKQGHSSQNCPSTGKTGHSRKVTICYFCGSKQHLLSGCKEYNPTSQEEGYSALPFAECFVCKEKGHLSGSCPKNDKGIYWKGGSCRFCGSVRHLANACPSRPVDSAHNASGRSKYAIDALSTIDNTKSGDFDDFQTAADLQPSQVSHDKKQSSRKSKTVSF